MDWEGEFGFTAPRFAKSRVEPMIQNDRSLPSGVCFVMARLKKWPQQTSLPGKRLARECCVTAISNANDMMESGKECS